MMKKINVILIGIIMVLSFVISGCQETSFPDYEMPEEPTTTEMPTEGNEDTKETVVEEVNEMEEHLIPPEDYNVVEISMVAKKWEFIPSEIKVKKGDNVKLTITSEDVTHGISLKEFDVDVKFNPGETKTVEFVANTLGTHTFSCNVFCGEGHGSMKGKIIVE